MTLCNSMDCNPPGSSVRGILQARILEWVAIPFSSYSLFQGIFPTQGLNPGLPHWQADSLPLSHLGSPRKADFPLKRRGARNSITFRKLQLRNSESLSQEAQGPEPGTPSHTPAFRPSRGICQSTNPKTQRFPAEVGFLTAG